MKLAYLAISTILLQVACSGAQPTATEYKKQLSASADAGGGGGGGADATAGKTFLKNSCEVCHNADGSAIPLTSTEVGAIKAIADGSQVISVHSQSVTDGIKKNQANIIAALGGDTAAGGGDSGSGSGGGALTGDPVVGKQIIDTGCVTCHGAGKLQPALTKASADGVVAAGKRDSHRTAKVYFDQNSADIIAHLKTLP